MPGLLHNVSILSDRSQENAFSLRFAFRFSAFLFPSLHIMFLVFMLCYLWSVLERAFFYCDLFVRCVLIENHGKELGNLFCTHVSQNHSLFTLDVVQHYGI